MLSKKRQAVGSPEEEVKYSMTFKVEDTSGEEPKLRKPGHCGTEALTCYSLINVPDTRGVASTTTKDQTFPASGPAL